MKKFLSLSILLLFVFTAVCLSTPAALGASGSEADDRQLLVVSDMGVHSTHPAGSLPAIRDAILAEADMIRLALQKTADGVFVLSEHTDLSIMCDTDNTPIAQKDWSEIQNLRLRERTGGNTPLTEEPLMNLTAVINTFGDRTTFLLDAPWEERDALYQAVQETEHPESCVFVLRTSAKKAVEWKNSLHTDIQFMVYEKTNIVFTAISAAKTLANEENGYLWLATSNHYGMIFNDIVTRRFSSLRGVMLQFTDPLECGKRQDTASYWEDVVARGYNVICTDDVGGCRDFVSNSNTARQELTDLLRDIDANWTLPDFSGTAFSDYRFRYNNAYAQAKKLSLQAFSGFDACKSAAYDLRTVTQEIDENYAALASGSAGRTITPARIGIASAAAAVFIGFEWFIHKHRGKRKN